MYLIPRLPSIQQARARAVHPPLLQALRVDSLPNTDFFWMCAVDAHLAFEPLERSCRVHCYVRGGAMDPSGY